MNGKLFFVWSGKAGGTELWTSDGTSDGTVLVRTFNPVPAAGPSSLTAAGRYLFFTLDDGVVGAELWRSDGSESGTLRVKDIAPGSAASAPASLTNVIGILYFSADDGVVRRELWRSDGTESGTLLVKDIIPGSAPSSPSVLTEVNGSLFFSADDGVHGAELWRSDGTEAGTSLVYDLNQGPASSRIAFIAGTRRGIFLSATTEATGAELWLIPYIGLSVDDVSIVEGNLGPPLARFTVTLSEASPDPVTIQYHTAGGSATPGSDYTPVMGTRTFAANQTSLTIDVPIQGDTVTEADESFFLNLSPVGPWSTHTRGQGKATITNDDAGPVLPTLSVVDKAEPEGNRSLSSVSRLGRLTVTLSAPSVDVVTVEWTWVDGTALGGTTCPTPFDYVSASGTATFAPGVTSQDVTVTICHDDAGVEWNEAFGLRLSNPTNATLSRPLGSYVLLNDDAPNPFGPRVQGVFQTFFANALETPMVGDFDGDGRTDILTLTAMGGPTSSPSPPIHRPPSATSMWLCQMAFVSATRGTRPSGMTSSRSARPSESGLGI